MRETQLSNKTLARIRMQVGLSAAPFDHAGNAITKGELLAMIEDIEALQDNLRHYSDAESAAKASAKIDGIAKPVLIFDEDKAVAEPVFDYLSSSIDPVIAGLQDFENIVALEQKQYTPLRTLPGDVEEDKGIDGQIVANSRITRWHPTDEQRAAIARGADILLEVMTFGGALAPVRMMITDQYVGAKPAFLRWFCAQTKATYAYGEELEARGDTVGD